MRCIWFVVAICSMVASSVHADIVFFDDFDDANGTAIDGKAADTGGPWTETGGSVVTNPPGIVDTTGAARVAFADLTRTLGAGEQLTLVYDGADTAGDFSAGFAGVSFFTGGTEQIFVGNPNNFANWGVIGNAIGGAQTTNNATEDSTATFTYTFDTGDWTFALDTGGNLAGTATAGLAIDRLRFANGAGGDLAIDSLSVDFSPTAVPEPTSAFVLLGGLGLAMLSRRRS